MTIGFTVIGVFANGKHRMAEVNLAKTRTQLGGAFLPEFQKIAVRYGQTFKVEIEEAPKRADGLPTFDYIVISYSLKSAAGVAKAGHLYLALTLSGLEKLAKHNKGELLNFDDANVQYRFMHSSMSAVVDMRKYTNVNAFWSKVRFYANYVYQTVFAH